MDEAKIAKFMKNLGLTRQEAVELLKDDEKVDKGANPHPLTAEQEKVAKKMRQADRTPTAYKFSKRERKPNEAKREILQALNAALAEIAENLEITNPERQIDFAVDGVKYRVILSAPRK